MALWDTTFGIITADKLLRTKVHISSIMDRMPIV